MNSDSWTEFVNKKIFAVKDNFYELPYVSNSPELKISILAEISVAKHDAFAKIISTNNPYCEGNMRYRNIEEGLWLFASNISFKQNVVGKTMYDSSQESNYYFLSCSVFEYKFPSLDRDNDSKKLLSKCWTFYKPKTEVSTYFYKETKGKFYNIAFSKKWAQENIHAHCESNSDNFLNFLDSETGFLTWLDIVPIMPKILTEIDEILERSYEHKIDNDDLKKPIFALIRDFFAVNVVQSRICNYVPLKNEVYAKVAKAEKEILNNLSKNFIGVSYISAIVNLSPTKLKAAFKMVFGLSMLQYHKQKNLQLAEQLIKKSAIPIKNIAAITGYESSSKFSAAFKKHFSVLPTQLRN